MKIKGNFVRRVADNVCTWYHKVQKCYKYFGKKRLRMCKIFDPLNAANNFIERSINENIAISPMKLQKLLYFLYREYMRRTDNPLFSERFETWQYGPVLSRVYHAFKNYGSQSISDYYTDSNGNTQKITDTTDNDFARALNDVWREYKAFTGIELSKLTHEPHTAWAKAWNSYNVFLNDDDIRSEAMNVR